MAHFTLSLLLLPLFLLILWSVFPLFFTNEKIAVLIMLGYITIGTFYFGYFTTYFKLRHPFNIIKVYKEGGWMATRFIAACAGLVIGGVLVLGLLFI